MTSYGWPERMTNYDHVARSGQYARRYESGRYERTAQCIDAFVGEAERVLELGCETGRWLSQLAGRLVVGIDPSCGMLGDARVQAPASKLVRAQAEALPFANGTFERPGRERATSLRQPSCGCPCSPSCTGRRRRADHWPRPERWKRSLARLRLLRRHARARPRTFSVHRYPPHPA